MAYNYAEGQKLPVCHDLAEQPVTSRIMQIENDSEYARGTAGGEGNPHVKKESY